VSILKQLHHFVMPGTGEREVLRALQDGDLVAVHSRVVQRPRNRGAALVHAFRF
jgi:predicted SnoaL-like aldol condensation-catalyzing enzyme